jgi:hypothetical protein
LIEEFKELKKHEKMARRIKINHETLGLIKIVKPKNGATTENKTFFEDGFKLGYNGVAVRSIENKNE